MTSGFLDPTFCQRAAFALAHSLWQGAVIAGLTIALVRWVSLTSLSRYWILYTAEALIALCLPVTFLAYNELPSTLDTIKTVASGLGQQSSRPPKPDVAVSQPQTRSVPGSQKVSQQSTGGDRRIYTGVVTAYLLGSSIMLVRLLAGLYGAKRLVTASKPILERDVLMSIGRAVGSMGFAYTPAIAYCSAIAVPSVVGILRPMLLLPFAIAADLTPKQLEVLVMHELAHIRRCDHIMNLLQRVIESLLFYHPMVWCLSGMIRHERELCCDDMVIAAGGPARRYARSLLRVAELSNADPLTNVALVRLAATGNVSELRKRVLRLVNPDEVPRVRLRRGGAIFASGTAFAAFVGPVYMVSLNRSVPTPAVVPMVSRGSSEVENLSAADPSERLIIAADTGTLEELQMLLSKGVNPNVRKSDGNTPLHHAVSRNRQDVTAALLSANADVNAQNVVGRTALHMALGTGRTSPLRTPGINESLIALLLERGAKATIPDQTGLTPLHLAVLGHYRGTAEAMLAAGADPEVKNGRSQTPLHLACETADPELIKLLLSRGADPRTADTRGWSAMDFVIWGTHAWDAAMVERVRQSGRLLIEQGSQPDVYAAVVLGLGAEVKAALDKDSTLIDKVAPKSLERLKLLHLAVMLDDMEMCRLLLSYGADVNCRTGDGRTALHIACGRAEPVPSIVRLLLDSNAEVRATTSSGFTPLHSAAVQRSPEVVDMLIAAGADLNVAPSGVTALLSVTTAECTRATAQGRSVIARLLDRGADPNIPDQQGQTPLHRAVIGRNLQLIDQLLNGHANPNLKDLTGRTSLYLSVSDSAPSLAIVQRLLDAGADPNIPDTRGQTSAEAAKLSGHADIAAAVNRPNAPTTQASSSAPRPGPATSD